MSTETQLAELLGRNADLFAAYEQWASGQIMLLAGSVDDPDSFNSDGGKTGALGYYPVVNVSGQTIYVPSLARLQAMAVGSADPAALEALLGAQVDSAAEQARIAQAGALRAEAGAAVVASTKAVADIALRPRWTVQAPALVEPGTFYSYDTGTSGASAAFTSYTFPVTPGITVLITAHVEGTGTALAVFKAGTTYRGYRERGLTGNGKRYTRFAVNIPADADTLIVVARVATYGDECVVEAVAGSERLLSTPSDTSAAIDGLSTYADIPGVVWEDGYFNAAGGNVAATSNKRTIVNGKAGDRLRIRGATLGTAAALVRWQRATGTIVSSEYVGGGAYAVVPWTEFVWPDDAVRALISTRSAEGAPYGVQRKAANAAAQVARLEAAESLGASNKARLDALSEWYAPLDQAAEVNTYYRWSDGAKATHNSFVSLKYPVLAGRTIRLTTAVKGAGTGREIWTNASNQVVAKSGQGIDTGSPVLYTDYETVAPAGAAFLLLTTEKSAGVTPSVKVFGVPPTNAEINALKARVAALEQGSTPTPSPAASYWAGKRIVYVGTSRPAGGGVAGSYVTRIAAALGATIHNVAVGSSCARAGIFSRIGADDPLGWSLARFESLSRSLSMTSAEKEDFITNYESKWRDKLHAFSRPDTLSTSAQALIRSCSYEVKFAPFLSTGATPADLWVFEHAVNDHNVGGALTDLATVPAVRNDRTYYVGAMQYLFEVIWADNPRARIAIEGYSETRKPRGAQSVAGQVALAGATGVPIIKVWEQIGWTALGPGGVQMSDLWLPDDPLHPHSDTSGRANDLMGTIIAAGLAQVR